MALALLGLVSALTAAGLLLVVRATSNQPRIRQVKSTMRAALFEIRLFNDDLGAIFRALREILWNNLIYLRLSAVPLLWAALPLAILTLQLQSFYGYAGLEPGEQALVKVRLAEGWRGRGAPADPGATLEAPPGVRIETPALWIPSTREVSWRIRAERPGEYDLHVLVDGRPVTKRVRVSSSIGRRSPVRAGGLVNRLLHPAEPPLPAGSLVESIAVTYRDGAIGVFGWEAHWALVFLASTMAFALALKRPFGVAL